MWHDTDFQARVQVRKADPCYTPHVASHLTLSHSAREKGILLQGEKKSWPYSRNNRCNPAHTIPLSYSSLPLSVQGPRWFWLHPSIHKSFPLFYWLHATWQVLIFFSSCLITRGPIDFVSLYAHRFTHIHTKYEYLYSVYINTSIHIFIYVWTDRLGTSKLILTRGLFVNTFFFSGTISIIYIYEYPNPWK